MPDDAPPRDENALLHAAMHGTHARLIMDLHNSYERVLWTCLANYQIPFSVLGVLTVVLRLNTVAGGDPVTMRALISTQGVGNVLVGTLSPLAPFLGYSAVLFACATLAPRVVSSSSHTTPTSVAAALAVIAASVLLGSFIESDIPGILFFVPGAIGVVALLFAAMPLYLGGSRVASIAATLRARFHWPTQLLSMSVSAALAVAALTSVIRSDPWLPSERLTDDTGQSVVGYVLSEADAEIVIMRHEDRLLQRLSADVRRTYCQTGPARWESGYHQPCD